MLMSEFQRFQNQKINGQVNYRVAFQSRRFNSMNELVKNSSLVLNLRTGLFIIKINQFKNIMILICQPLPRY